MQLERDQGEARRHTELCTILIEMTKVPSAAASDLAKSSMSSGVVPTSATEGNGEFNYCLAVHLTPIYAYIYIDAPGPHIECRGWIQSSKLATQIFKKNIKKW